MSAPLYLRIDPHCGIPLGSQIANALRLAIVGQRLPAGEQLPSARALAADLRVNFHTVRKAYGDLEAEGLLEFRRGLGTFATAAQKPPLAELGRLVRSRLEALFGELAGLDVDAGDLERLVVAEVRRLKPASSRHT